jgi:hypothetical protein
MLKSSLIFSDVNTIFRGNTLVSKCMDELMKIVGIRYLHETLRTTIEQVLHQMLIRISNYAIKSGPDGAQDL